MNSLFRPRALAALLLLLTSPLLAVEGPFSIVPIGDVTYSGLSDLERVGLVPAGSSTTPLTRFEVAKLLVLAEGKAIVLAQADEIPPPDDSDPTLTAPSGESSPAPAVESAPEPAPASEASGEFGDELESAPAPGSAKSASVLDDSPEALKKALRTLRTLKQAYDYEVNRLKGGVQALEKQMADLEAEQYDLRKRLKGIEQYPTVAMHGVGRARGFWERFSGTWPGETFFPVEHGTRAYLDMGPEGHVSKEVRWKSMFRFASGLQPNDSPTFTVRRLEIEFNPPWFALDACDFEESYTPLTLWNRNSLDLRYFPEEMERADDWEKYEDFLNHEPNWPLRGARFSTHFMWDEGSVFESLQLSTFAHMVRNGFNDTSGDGWYFGPFLHSDWLLGAKAELATQDLWVGSSPVKFSVSAHGLMMDQDMGSDAVTAVYNPSDPDTWAKLYRLGSVRPEIRLGGEAGLAICLGMEYAHSFYQDDQTVPARDFNDYAMLGGLTLKWEDSSLALQYLNVGPYYFSPMAQARQRWPYFTPPDGVFGEYLEHRPQVLYMGTPRPPEIFTYYDRTQDSAFPYGLATPNREGFGGELDLKFLEKDAMRLKGSAYYLWEINGNLVVNNAGTGFVPVENPLGPNLNLRKFLYINLGPSVDIGHLAGLPGSLEIGVNVRYENTDSAFGSLTGLWLVGGVGVEILPVWRISGSASLRKANGTEVGLEGTLLARYPYLYDNSDLPDPMAIPPDLGLGYVPFTVDGEERAFEVSNAFRVNKNSTIYLLGGISTTNLLPWGGPQGTLNKEYLELLYEVQF